MTAIALEDGGIQLTTFVVSDDEFGMDIRDVYEVMKPTPITLLPRMPSHIIGVLNLRGNVIPVQDLRLKLGYKSTIQNKNTRIMIIQAKGQVFGLLVDAVTEVCKVAKDNIQAPPETIRVNESGFIKGIVNIDGRMVMIFDTEKLV